MIVFYKIETKYTPDTYQKMGYIYTEHAYEIGRTYSIKENDITVYDNILAIRRHRTIDCTRKYEVSTDDPSEVTIVREISKDEFARLCTGRYVDRYGTNRWYAGGRLHRHDGPAIIHADGNKEWVIDGRWHRDDGPATLYADGEKEWHIDDTLHREDGPAVIYADGTQEWWFDNDEIEPPLR